MKKINYVINLIKEGFENKGYSIALYSDPYKYSLNRDYTFFWITYNEIVDIFIDKDRHDRKISYMNIKPYNYESFFNGISS